MLQAVQRLFARYLEYFDFFSGLGLIRQQLFLNKLQAEFLSASLLLFDAQDRILKLTQNIVSHCQRSVSRVLRTRFNHKSLDDVLRVDLDWQIAISSQAGRRDVIGWSLNIILGLLGELMF